MPRTTPRLTTTSRVILALLTLKPWTTYELAQQMERGFRRLWPRAARKLYEEPKKLVALGLATARRESVGQRARTMYAITAKGRREVRRWVGDADGTDPSFESEHLMKLFFSEHGSRDAALRQIDALEQWAKEYQQENLRFATEYLETGSPFPDRLAQIILVGRWHVGFADFIRGWTQEARGVVASWPENAADAEADLAFLETVRARLGGLR